MLYDKYEPKRAYEYGQKPHRRKKYLAITAVLILLITGGVFGYTKLFSKKTPVQAADKLEFSSSVSAAEQTVIKQAIIDQKLTYRGSVKANATSALSATEGAAIVEVFVPVTNKYAIRQNINTSELATVKTYMSDKADDTIKKSVNELTKATTQTLSTPLAQLPDTDVAFIPVSELSPEVKLLSLDGAYYLDSYTTGALFRTLTFEGTGATSLKSIVFNRANKESTFSFMQTGVTALTRRMMHKLNQFKDPTFFSKDIAAFLSSADITHVSNEVSFQPNCQYHNALFCSPPQFIETLKASGVDVVELTGNHNNDLGRQFNTDTINQYRALGWGTVGGGLNTADAAKPYIMDKKGSKVTLLAYNYPDSPNGGAIASATAAGANSFDFDRIQSDIAAAKQQGAQAVIVDVQFWECYAYPEGYLEYPICDKPIPNQQEVFRKIADLGASMVVGTSAHQPQTYEFYNGAAIYYGLGNLYFDQTNWPGTERGIILTHYYHQGKILQTRLTPTVYNKDFVVRVMNVQESNSLLNRLNTARP